MKKFLRVLIISYFTLFVTSLSALAIEAIGPFKIEDVQYQSFDDQVRLAIIMNSQIECVSYELDTPLRIVIDPLDEVYCNYEDKVYFEEGLIKSIEFIKTEGTETPGEPFYAIDFLTIELREPVSYKIVKDGPNILLNISEVPKEDKVSMPAPEVAEKVEEEKIDLPPTEEEPKPQEPSKIEEKISPVADEEKEEERKKDIPEETSKEEPKKKEPAMKEEPKKREEKPQKKAKKPKETKDTPVMPDLNKELTLEDCVNVATANSLPLKIAEEQVKLAKLKANEAFREMLPVASLLWSESKGRITDSWYRGRKYGVEFKQALFHGGELFFTWEQAKANVEIAQENYKKVKEDLAHNVSKAYYELAKALNKLDLQRELFEYIKKDMELAKKEYEMDLSTQLEFLNTQSLYDQVYFSISSAENELSLKSLALNKAMNIDISSELKIYYKLELKESDIDMDECVELAMQHRAELKTKELMVRAAKLGEGVAQSQMWPQLDLVGKYLKAAEEFEPRAMGMNLRNERFLGITASIPVLDHTFEFTHKRGKFAPTVTTFGSDTEYFTDTYKITPFEKLDRYTSIKNAYIGRQQALSDLKDVKHQLHSEVREAFYSLREAQIKVKGSINNLKLYEKELLAAQLNKELNEVTVSEVMSARIKLFGEKGNYINALGDIYLAIASLNKAVGIGGYFK